MDRSGSWGNTCDREAASLVKATNKCQPQERVRTEHKQSKRRAKIPKRRFRISLSDNWRISAAKSRNNEGLGRAPRPYGAFFSLLFLFVPRSLLIFVVDDSRRQESVRFEKLISLLRLTRCSFFMTIFMRCRYIILK